MKRKCAIYNRISSGTPEKLAKKTCELIEYCVNFLGIRDYVVFEEISHIKGNREEFNNMMSRIHEKEFTDALTFDFTRYYRNDNEKLGKILADIDDCNVTIHLKNDKSIFYIRKQIEGIETLEEQKNRLKKCAADKGIKILDIVDHYCSFDNMAKYLGYQTGIYAGLKAESEKK